MNKNLDKLKQFFRSNKTNNAHERVYVLNSEIERELRKDSSNEKRVKLLRDLGDIVISNRLEEVFDTLIIQLNVAITIKYHDSVCNSKVMVANERSSGTTKAIRSPTGDTDILHETDPGSVQRLVNDEDALLPTHSKQ